MNPNPSAPPQSPNPMAQPPSMAGMAAVNSMPTMNPLSNPIMGSQITNPNLGSNGQPQAPNAQPGQQQGNQIGNYLLKLALLGPKTFANVIPGGAQFMKMLKQHQINNQVGSRAQAMQGLPAGTMDPAAPNWMSAPGAQAPVVPQAGNPLAEAGGAPASGIAQMLNGQ